MPGKQRRACRLVLGAAVVALAGLLLIACGKGSPSTRSTTATPAKTTTAAVGSKSTGFARLRACMRRQGIALPQSGPRQEGPPASGALGVEGGPQLPKGVSRTRFDAALKRCGARSFGGTGLAGGRLNSAEFRRALGRFAECLRQHGIPVAAPKVAGTGPVFTTKGINTGSAKFLAAERQCSGDLGQAFRRASGALPPGTNPGAPGPLGAVPTPKK
jgi:hypothetical protein